MFGKQDCKVIKVADGFLPYGSGINFMPPSEEREYIDRIMSSVDQFPDSSIDDHLPVYELSNKTLVNCNKVELADIESKKPLVEQDLVDVNSKKPLVKQDLVDSNVYNGESFTFYNSSFNGEIGNPSFKKNLKGKTVSFKPPKKLGKEKLIVNFAISPVAYQFDPLQEIFVNSNVEYGLDNFYSLESIGIKEEDGVAYDNDQVENFRKSISYKEGHYHVKLPWKADLIKQVPSNLKISLAVAERVYDKLEKKRNNG